MNTTKDADFTAVKDENGEAAPAPTATASEPETENRENSTEGPTEYGVNTDKVQDASSPNTEVAQEVTTGSDTKPTEELVAPMTMEELEQRDQLVVIACKGIDGALVAYQALKEIRERKLFRDRHKTFEEFCRDVLDISEARASQLITHAIQCEELKKHFKDSQIPTSERAVRELRRAPSAIRIKIIEKALELAGGVRPKTAHIVNARAAIEGFKEQAPKAKPEVISSGEAMLAAETFKAFLEKCERRQLTIGDAEKITELTKGIAELAAERLKAA